MGWTKRDLIEGGFTEIGLPGYTFTLPPEQLVQALNRLDAMMARWNSQGIRLGYALPPSPADSDLDDASGLPDAAFQAVVSNLGCFGLAQTIGKTVSADAKIEAQAAFDALQSWCAAGNIPEMQFPATMPRGAGNTRNGPDGRTFYQPADTVEGVDF